MTTPLRRPRRAPHADLPVGSADVLPRLAATAWPYRAALRAGNRTTTFAELDRDVSRLAFGLRQSIGGDGLPVVVSTVLGLDFPVALHAVLRSGNVAVPVSPRLPAATFDRLLDTVRPCAVVLARAMYERVRPVLAAHPDVEQTLLLDAQAGGGPLTCAELATRGGLLVEPRDRDENELAVLTGEERLTHHRLKVRAAAGAVADGLTERSVVLDATPVFDLTHLGAGLTAGATQVLFGNPDPAAAVREAARVGATHLRGAGSTARTGEAMAS
jgi:long-chain acyl-CoA synthetase